MNVVFWSCVPGMSGVSGSVAAMAMSTAAQHKVKCSVMQLQMDRNSLIPSFIKAQEAAGMSFFENVGVDALARIAKGGAPAEGEVENVSFSYVGRCLNIFTSTHQKSEAIYKNDLIPQIPGIFSTLNDTFRINFIDVPAGENEYAQAALQCADIIVACLPQTRWVVKHFYESYNFDQEKLFVLLGDSDDACAVNASNVASYLHKKVKKGHCLSIPHCTEFANAMNQGKVINYFIENLRCKPNDNSYKFMQACSKCAQKLLDVRG